MTRRTAPTVELPLDCGHAVATVYCRRRPLPRTLLRCTACGVFYRLRRTRFDYSSLPEVKG